MEHDAKRYIKGCRCDVCRAANTARCRANRERRASGEAMTRGPTRLPPGERIGDRHGRLEDYIRGCRCEECRSANRDNARAHRERVKTGTVGRHVPPKRPQATVVKTYAGHPALTDGWEVLGVHRDGEAEWFVCCTAPDDDGWRQMKVSVRGRAERKANYWGSFKVDPFPRWGRGKDIKVMKEHRPELWRRMNALLMLRMVDPQMVTSPPPLA